jgi:hypothetical protein
MVYAAACEFRDRVRPLDRHAWLVAYLEGSRLVGEIIDSAPQSFAVIGRHERCDLRIERSPGVSLRQALLRPSAVEAEGELEIIGLRGRFGLELFGAGPISRAVLRGPAVALLAGAPVALVPSRGELPAELPAPDLVEETRAREDRSLDTAREGTLKLSDLTPRSNELPATAVQAAAGKLSIVTEDAHASFHVAERELARGIILGRYQRCDLRAPEVPLSSDVSRVHALLVRDGGRLSVYDTASTNGLQVERGSELRRARMLSFDLEKMASFYLGHAAGVIWEPRRGS